MKLSNEQAQILDKLQTSFENDANFIQVDILEKEDLTEEQLQRRVEAIRDTLEESLEQINGIIEEVK